MRVDATLSESAIVDVGRVHETLLAVKFSPKPLNLIELKVLFASPNVHIQRILYFIAQCKTTSALSF